MKRYLILLLSLFIGINSIVARDSLARVVRVGAFNYYPAIFQDENGEIKGFFVESFAEIERREGIKIQYVYGSWKDGLDRLSNGEIDLMPSMAKLSEREKLYSFGSIPLLTVWSELYVKPNSEIDKIVDVEGKNIGIMVGDANAKNFTTLVENLNIKCNIIEFQGFEHVFKALQNDEIDAGVVNNTFGAPKAEEYNLRSTGIVFNPFDIFLASKKDKNLELLKLTDSYLSKWRHDRESVYNKSRQKWAHGDVGAVRFFPTWLKNLLILFGTLIVIMILFLLLLKKRVNIATQEIVQRERHLRDSEARWKRYIDSSPMGIFIVDGAGNFKKVNKAASSITGFSEKELVSMNIADIQPAETLSEDLKNFKNLQEIGEISVELRFIHKDGFPRWWSINAVKLSDDEYLSFTFDITKEKNREKLIENNNMTIMMQNMELKRSKERAEESDRLKTAFLQNMSHEIRTPLNAIIGFSDLLADSTDNKEEQLTYASIIKSRGEDLLSIINDILDVSIIESGKITLNNTYFNLFDLKRDLESIYFIYAKKIKKEDLPFLIEIPEKYSEKYFIGDVARIKQIIMNLVNNSFKFTDQGYIKVQFNHEDGILLISVSDTGIGIPEDKKSLVFERFTQTSSSISRLYGGVGLGLSIVSSLVKMMKGDIELYSEEGKGTKIIIKIPSISEDKL